MCRTTHFTYSTVNENAQQQQEQQQQKSVTLKIIKEKMPLNKLIDNL